MLEKELIFRDRTVLARKGLPMRVMSTLESLNLLRCEYGDATLFARIMLTKSAECVPEKPDRKWASVSFRARQKLAEAQ